MEYNDWLWENMLRDAGYSISSDDGVKFDLSIESKKMNVTDTASVTTADLLRDLEALKGAPHEQLRELLYTKVDRIIADVESALGWGDVVDMFNTFDIGVYIKGRCADVNTIDLL